MKIRAIIAACAIALASLFTGSAAVTAAPLSPANFYSTSGCSVSWTGGWLGVGAQANCNAKVAGGATEFRVRFVRDGMWVVTGPWRDIGENVSSRAYAATAVFGTSLTVEKR